MKFPRIAHLPWSPGATPDDLRTVAFDGIRNQKIIITEKLDGECTSFDAHGVHARSEDSRAHPSQDWVRALHGKIRHQIPPYYQIFLENVYAKHSIYYNRLTTFAYVMMIFDHEFQLVLGWERTVEMCHDLGLIPVPVIDIVETNEWDDTPFRFDRMAPSFSDEMEGYVVRPYDSFHTVDFGLSVFKYVRANHVQTDEHWKRNWSPNKLLKDVNI